MPTAHLPRGELPLVTPGVPPPLLISTLSGGYILMDAFTLTGRREKGEKEMAVWLAFNGRLDSCNRRLENANWILQNPKLHHGSTRRTGCYL